MRPGASADGLVFSEIRTGNPVETPPPVVTLNGPDRLTNECHNAFTDPGATARGGPVAIAAGGYHSLALKRDGTVAAWGYWLAARTTPAGWSDVVAIAAGEYYSLALRSDGSVVAWGHNGYGQTSVPPNLTNVVRIASGWAQLEAADRLLLTANGWLRLDSLATALTAVRSRSYI